MSMCVCVCTCIHTLFQIMQTFSTFLFPYIRFIVRFHGKMHILGITDDFTFRSSITKVMHTMSKADTHNFKNGDYLHK